MALLVVVVDEGLKSTMTPAGWPEPLKATVPEKPPLGFTVTATEPEDPLVMEMLEGLSDRLKEGVLAFWITKVPCTIASATPVDFPVSVNG